MTAFVLFTCPEHPHFAVCDDDAVVPAASVAEARVLYEAKHPGAAPGKIALIVIACDQGRCTLRVYVPETDTVAEAREIVADHNHGWYTARRAGGRIIDACQFHLGTCCVHHARLDMPTLDRSAILPGKTGTPTRPAQLDLFSGC